MSLDGHNKLCGFQKSVFFFIYGVQDTQQQNKFSDSMDFQQ